MLILQVLFFTKIIFSIVILDHSYTCQEKLGSGTENSIGKIEKEKEGIAQMRILGADLIENDDFYKNDHFLMRWLRARDFNTTDATDMFRAAINWRTINRIDSILNETIITFSVNPYLYDGFDKEGRPLAFFSVRYVNPRKLQFSWKHEDMIRTFDQVLERGYQIVKNVKHSLANGEPVSSFVAIIDFTGATMKYMCFRCIPLYIEGAFHFENYYPGAADLIIVINVNRFALAVIELLTPFVSIHSRKALKLFGTNRTEWSEYLLSIISPVQLPLSFGGTRISNF